MSIFWFLIIFVVPVMLFICSKKRGKELLQLFQNGKKTTATVSKRQRILRSSPEGTTKYRVSYVFKTESGEAISHSVYVSYDLYQETPVGSEVDIVYLANDPKISALGYMVGLVRSAMKN